MHFSAPYRHPNEKRVSVKSTETLNISGGADGVRTRDPRRDRPVF